MRLVYLSPPGPSSQAAESGALIQQDSAGAGCVPGLWKPLGFGKDHKESLTPGSLQYAVGDSHSPTRRVKVCQVLLLLDERTDFFESSFCRLLGETGFFW